MVWDATQRSKPNGCLRIFYRFLYESDQDVDDDDDEDEDDDDDDDDDDEVVDKQCILFITLIACHRL